MDPISFLINLVVGTILSIAGTLLQQSQQVQQRRQTGTRGAAQIGGKVPQSFLIGTVGDPGKLEYRGSWGNAGEVPNANYVEVISFGDLPISGCTGLYVNGVEVTKGTTGTTFRGTPVPEYFKGRNHLWWQFFDGTQTETSSYLLDQFPSGSRRWMEDMIGRGIPLLITTALWNEKLFTGFPSGLAQFEGIPLYDIRKDSTAGGSGSHRWDDQSTWEFSDNNLVIVYNIFRGIKYQGEIVWGGTATAAQLPFGPWAAAMDACDVEINLNGGGTQRRFRGGRRIDFNELPADVAREFLVGACARVAYGSDGTIWPLVGVPDTADGAFSDDDVLGTEPLGSIPFPNLDDTINGGVATFRAPQQAWEDKETAPYYRSDLEALDDGRRNIASLDLSTTFDGRQAQRVLKATVEEARRFRRHVVALPAQFAQYRPLQVLSWTSGRFGYSSKHFLITARTRSIWGWVVFGLQEIDPSDEDWNPETDEQPISFAPVVTDIPPPQVVEGVYVSPAIEQDGEGRGRRAGYDVFWPSTAVSEDVSFVRVSHRMQGETAISWTGLIALPELLEGSARVLQALIPKETYEVQVDYVTPSGREIEASGWMTVTIPDVPDTVDIVPAQLGREMQNWGGLLTGDSIGAIQTQLAQLRALKEQIALAALSLDNTVSQQINLTEAHNGASAAVIAESRKAIANLSDALAQLEIDVVAIVNNSLAGGYFSITSEVNTEESIADILFKVRAIKDGLLSQAVMLMRASVGSGGQTNSIIAMLADAFYLMNADGELIDSPFSIVNDVIRVNAIIQGEKMTINPFTGFFSFG